MTKPLNTFPNTFKIFYKLDLPAGKQAQFIKDVCDTCEVSKPTFYRWLNDPEEISELQKKAIAEIASKAMGYKMAIDDLFINPFKTK